jgi:hypothetical protein
VKGNALGHGRKIYVSIPRFEHCGCRVLQRPNRLPQVAQLHGKTGVAHRAQLAPTLFCEIQTQP